MVAREATHGKKKFLVFLALYIVLDCIDFLLTYIGTPDLMREANPLVMVYGYGWVALIISAIIHVLIFALIIYFVFARFKRSIISCEGFTQYLSMLYFDRPDKFIWTFYRFPKVSVFWRYFAACMGYLFVITSLLTKMLAIVEWIGILSNNYSLYINYYIISITYFGSASERIKLAIACAAVWLLAMYLWYYREYRINKRALAQINNGNI